MKALIYTAKNKVEVGQIEEPQVRAKTVKIKVDYCALCATDVHIVTQGLYGLPTPVPLGHESCGTIIELGEGAAEQGWKIGDRVSVASCSPCGVCDECKRGNDIFCDAMPVPYYAPLMAVYAVVDINMIFRIPAYETDVRKYCLAEPCAAAMRGIDLADIRIGDTVAISGVGGIGSILLNMILLAGGARVTAIEPVESKRKLALEMGAQYTIDPSRENLMERVMEITDGRGFDRVFEVSGVPAAAPPVMEMLAHKGKAIYFAVYPMDYELPVNLYQMFAKETSIQGVFTTIYNYPRVMDIIPRLQIDKIIGIELPLDRAAEAFDLFLESKYPKIVVKC